MNRSVLNVSEVYRLLRTSADVKHLNAVYTSTSIVLFKKYLVFLDSIITIVIVFALEAEPEGSRR